MNNEEKAKIGIKYSINKLIKAGYTAVRDVARNKRNVGYDILAWKGKRRIRIEVKTTTKKYGIPDSHGNFREEKNPKLIAEWLILVHLNKRNKPTDIIRLTRDTIFKTLVGGLFRWNQKKAPAILLFPKWLRPLPYPT